ncbi:TRAP transporter small permease subunit [Halomonas tibetensis]|uniref:TRAP transporter small permease protein n=1 Tax=Halomonas tibetensis TaxID=2259590 RepID=A0ABV7B657_9GAMM
MSTKSSDSSLPPDLPTNHLSHRLDISVAFTGKLLSWLWIATLVVVLTNVFSRFILGRGSVALEEMSWHLFGATMILTLAYAVVTDDHVRVDVLREKFSLRFQAWVDLAGIMLLMMPLLYFMIDGLFEYAQRSFLQGESSQSASGLPYRYIIKSSLPIGMALIAIALFSRALRCTTLLFNFPRELRLRHPTNFR